MSCPKSLRSADTRLWRPLRGTLSVPWAAWCLANATSTAFCQGLEPRIACTCFDDPSSLAAALMSWMVTSGTDGDVGEDDEDDEDDEDGEDGEDDEEDDEDDDEDEDDED